MKEASEAFTDLDEEDWKTKLEYDLRTMTLKNTLRNLRLILENDPQLKGIVFNQLADGLEIQGDLPWKHSAKFWRDADDSQLVCYVDGHYGSFSQRNNDVAVIKVSDDRAYHPIRRYFESLPPWDGIPRVDTLLVDYLGAEDTPYVEAVTRKALCAAYRRVYEPGIKFDYITVLNGDQGIGKSTLIAKLGMDWYSDSLNLSDMNDKTAAEKLQGFWIHEIGEMAGMKKADLEKVKAFVSRCDDKYRASFGRRVTPHPRQCIRKKGYKVLAYLSVRTISTERSWYKTYSNCKLKKLSDWPKEYYMDLKNTAWRKFLVSRATDLRKKGFDGWWLDNLDVYEEYKSKAMFNAVLAILQDIKVLNGYVMVNGGSEWVDDALDKKVNLSKMINGYTKEEVFSLITSYAGKGKFSKQEASQKKFYQGLLKRVKKAKVETFLLEYTKDATLKTKIKDWCAKNKVNGYYISVNVDL